MSDQFPSRIVDLDVVEDGAVDVSATVADDATPRSIARGPVATYLPACTGLPSVLDGLRVRLLGRPRQG